MALPVIAILNCLMFALIIKDFSNAKQLLIVIYCEYIVSILAASIYYKNIVYFILCLLSLENFSKNSSKITIAAIFLATTPAASIAQLSALSKCARVSLWVFILFR